MKLKNPSYEIFESQGCLKDIERAARTCYKSEDNTSFGNESSIKLVQNLIKRKHNAMLEFGTNIIIDIPDKVIMNLIPHMDQPFFHGINISKIPYTRTLMSMNPRAALELLEYFDYRSYNVKNKLNTFLYTIEMNLDIVIRDTSLEDIYPQYKVIAEKDLKGQEIDIHKTYTVKLICDRGISHEIVRHRLCSFAQWSTRYVDGLKHMFFIKPVWFDSSSAISKFIFNSFIKCSEFSYKTLRKCGWKPEQARNVLATSLATEIVIKATKREWEHIFALRCDKAAHSQMRVLMIPLSEEIFKK